MVLKRLRDGNVPDVEELERAAASSSARDPGLFAKMLKGCVELSGFVRNSASAELLREPGSDAEVYRKEMQAAGDSLQARMEAAVRALQRQQRRADACQALPLEALLSGIGIMINVSPPVAITHALATAVRVSYTPNLLHLAAECVKYFKSVGVGPFALIDVGAGCGAARAAFHAACADQVKCASAAADQAACAAADADGADQAACAAADAADQAASSADGVGCSGDQAQGPAFVYRGSNMQDNCPYGYEPGELVAGELDGVVPTGAADFTDVSLGLLEPRPGDPVRTKATNRQLFFLRWKKGGTKAVVYDDSGKQFAVKRDNAAFDAVVLLAWAPNSDEDNFLPEFLRKLPAVQRPLDGLLLLVVGEGLGGCTGDGHPFVHSVLHATPSVHEDGFSQWRAQVPGITSKGTLFRASDVVASLKAARVSSYGWRGLF